MEHEKWGLLSRDCQKGLISFSIVESRFRNSTITTEEAPSDPTQAFRKGCRSTCTFEPGSDDDSEDIYAYACLYGNPALPTSSTHNDSAGQALVSTHHTISYGSSFRFVAFVMPARSSEPLLSLSCWFARTKLYNNSTGEVQKGR